jgi:PAS domain S-box-containing protein
MQGGRSSGWCGVKLNGEIMAENNLNRFFVSIVFPSILAVVFFVVLIFAAIIPAFERNIMEGKKEMISELTNTAWSLLEEYYQEVAGDRMAADSAKMLAVERIGKVRYGEEYKDYFWIIDDGPVMILHPYRPELNGTDLSDYQDPDGKRLFVEAVQTVAAGGEGYIDYMWQWKDDSTRIVPKLSYVKGFEPWGWIVGTGIYLEDVRMEIRALTNRLLRITLVFALLISAILAFIIRQSLTIERRRSSAEQKLRLSRQKYKSLVEASTEGTLMILKEEIIFSNVKFSRLSGYDPAEVREMSFEKLFSLQWKNMVDLFRDPRQSVSYETVLNCRDGIDKEVVLSASQVSYAEESGYIIVVKEVSAQRQLERDTERLSEELQTSLLLMNQPIAPLVSDLLRCQAAATISDAARLMTRKKRNIIFVTQNESVIGVVNSSDLKKRVVAAGVSPSRPVMEVMTSPVETISEKVLLYEVLLELKSRGVSHLATLDAKGNISGVIGHENILEMHQNSISFLIREIEIAEDVNQLAQIYKRVPVLVKALLESGDRTDSINRIITSVADAMHKRVVGFAIEEMGLAPCRFAFMVMGSEGRGEQTLATDQDNAIVYEDVEGGMAVADSGRDEKGGKGRGEGEGAGERAEESSGNTATGKIEEEIGDGAGKVERKAAAGNSGQEIVEGAGDEASDEIHSYFLELGERVNRYLHTIGYQYCKGEVMAKNPKWTQPLERWKQYFSGWVNNSNPRDILEAAIFFDFRYIHGDQQLVQQLRDHVHKASANKPVFFYHMAQSVLKFKPPMNIFGRIVGRDSGGDALELDIKKAMMPVLFYIRLYAIRENLGATNSLERLHALAERKSVDSTSYEELVQAYELMMRLRLKFQVESISQNEEPGNIIDLNRLTRMEAAMLKKIFSQITDLQTKVGFEFKG